MREKGGLTMATVRISGNWRNPGKMEWGGAPALDDQGKIERTVQLPAGVYEAIEEAIAKHQVQGSVNLGTGQRVDWFLDR